MLSIVNITSQNNFADKPKVGISACRLGRRVRYDGGHKRDSFLAELYGKFVEFVPLCPEVEAGMGVPRESVRLVSALPGDIKMIAERSGTDWTAAMHRFAAKRLRELACLRLSGYIFKKVPRAAASSGCVFTTRRACPSAPAAAYSLLRSCTSGRSCRWRKRGV